MTELSPRYGWKYWQQQIKLDHNRIDDINKERANHRNHQ
ncbi:hypothetical protein YPPY94_1075, partial [Yersinia pestis PY-94]